MRDLGFLYKLLRRGEEASQLLGEAAAGLRRTLGDDEEALVAASLAASVYLDLRRLDEAEALLFWAIPRMKPGLREKAMAIYNLGCVQALKGDRDAALESLRDAAALGFGILNDPNLEPLQADPEFVALASTYRVFDRGARESLFRRADYARGAGRDDEAEAIYRFLLANLPRTERAVLDDVRSRLAAALYVRGRFAEARPLLVEAVESVRSRQPLPWGELQGFLDLLFRVDFALGDHGAARREIDEAIGYSPPGMLLRNKPPYFLLALREAAFGDPDTAVRWLEQAVNHGFDKLSVLEGDRILRRLHGRPAFEQLVALVKQKRRLPGG
jgi:tetratricopeptide (TPR) repeat protein